jgi:Flp pilus assembly protein TadB
MGVAMLLRAWRPAPEPLTSALHRIHQPATPSRAIDPDSTRVSRWGLHAGGWLTDRLAADRFGWTVPRRDLALLGQSVESFGLRKLLMALFGLTLPGWIALPLLLLGVQLPVTLPALTGLLLAAGFFFAPDLVVRSAAREARDTFTASVGAYLDLVALERAADGGAAEALERAAAVADGWVFRRIRESLERARLSGLAPWSALTDLAAEVGVSDLADLADIVALAGDDGAAVYTTLTAKAAALRNRALAAARADANSASEKLTLPGILLCFAFLLLVCYPGVARVLGI